MATRFPNGSGNEAAANGRAAGGERGATSRDRSARSLAASPRRDRGAVRAGGQNPNAQDDPGLCAPAPRAVAVDRADAGRTRAGKSGRGTIGADVPRDGGAAAFAGGGCGGGGEYAPGSCERVQRGGG